MLDLAGDEPFSFVVAGPRRAEDAYVVAFRSTGGEDYLVWSRVDFLGNCSSCSFDSFTASSSSL